MKYRMFFIGYDRHVAFTVNENAYTRKLLADRFGYYVNFNGNKLRIKLTEIYR